LTKTEFPGTLTLDNESGIDTSVSEQDLRILLENVAYGENVRFGLLEAVYVDEAEIVRINKEHLDREYITDVITFSYGNEAGDFSDNADTIETDGTIFMCAQRILEQSVEFNTDAATEFKRVFVHGLLHLCGYDDATADQKAEMTKKENIYLD